MSYGFGAMGVAHKIMKIYAGMKMYAKNLLKEAAAATSPGQQLLNGSPHIKKSLAAGGRSKRWERTLDRI